MAAFVLAISCHEADFNDDGKVDVSDLAHFGSWYPSYNCNANNSWCGGCDFYQDGDVDLSDFANFADWYGDTCYNCTDSDGGLVYDQRGNVTGLDDGDYYDYGDYCFAPAMIREYYCDGLYWAFVEAPCNTTGNYTWCNSAEGHCA